MIVHAVPAKRAMTVTYVPPTALPSVLLVQEIALSGPVAETAPVAIDHAVPFQRSTKGPTPAAPTAMQLAVLTQERPDSMPVVAPVGSGLLTIDHVEPFHRSTSVPVPDPTAKQDVTPGQAMPDS